MNEQTFVLLDQVRNRVESVIKAQSVTEGSDLTIANFLNERLPAIVSLAQSVFADGRVDFFEIVRIITFVSSAVRDALTIFKNKPDAKEVVKAIVKALADLLLPDGKLKDTLTNDSYLDGVVQFVYSFIVKFRR